MLLLAEPTNVMSASIWLPMVSTRTPGSAAAHRKCCTATAGSTLSLSACCGLAHLAAGVRGPRSRLRWARSAALAACTSSALAGGPCTRNSVPAAVSLSSQIRSRTTPMKVFALVSRQRKLMPERSVGASRSSSAGACRSFQPLLHTSSLSISCHTLS
eukprot:scaffold186198_cov31-Tisochrysis_lutea.AAC.3